jgi:hypothetical protein
MENLDLEELSGFSDIVSNGKFGNVSEKDFITSCGDVSRNSEVMWRSGLKSHDDEQVKLHLDLSQCISNRHQVYVIINDTSEEVDDENNPVINPHNLEQGVNHRAEGETESAVADMEKVYLSTEDWRMIKAAVNYGAAIPVGSRREVLMGYQYTLHQQKKQLLQERSEIRRRHKSSTASRILQEERINASHTGGGRHCEPNRGEAERQNKENRA